MSHSVKMEIRRKYKIMKQYCFTLLFLLALVMNAQVSVPFDSENWSFSEREPKRFENINGKEALYLNGHAMLENVVFQDGIIEIDFMAQKKRAFAGLQFRAQGEGDNETFYVRLHKSGFPDAVQYNPEYNGEPNWQLYREHQAVVNFDPSTWNHLKIVFRGSVLKAYLNDSPEPILSVSQLKRNDKQGYIGFYSFLGAYFANFTYTAFSDTTPLADVKDYAPDVIQGWELSDSYDIAHMETNRYPDISKMDWEYFMAEPSGLLPINKYRSKTSSGNFEQNPVNIIWARHTFTSTDDSYRKFSFDFSDDVVLYFNGVKLFEGINGFRAKGPTFRGDMLIGGNVLYLKAKKGKNEILAAVSDKANGWAIMGKME